MAFKDFLEKARDFFVIGDEDETVGPQAQVASAPTPPVAAQPQIQPKRPQVVTNSAPTPEPRQEQKKQVRPEPMPNQGHSNTPKRKLPPQTQGLTPTIAIREPAAYDNVMESARVVRNGESVLLNFKNMSDQQARRSIDFLTGVIFTIDGDIQNVGGQIFLLTPNGMAVDAEKELSVLSGRNFEGLDNF
ncbi:cell division protein SepF [Lactococcus hodotermopsidis]|uniref:Cell division protein SepF n=1 Tax=Pseudolactococcus hodotermopsidis TaxID=2709157 RepID=A0A6A0BCG1_9LACT|nr:cell division protein SepF [Lactococcus hodotermopsidis]GFH42114.1 cell division protein SepF [Lactococcus hodotermopsidis]